MITHLRPITHSIFHAGKLMLALNHYLNNGIHTKTTDFIPLKWISRHRLVKHASPYRRSR